MIEILTRWMWWLRRKGANVPVSRRDWVLLAVLLAFLLCICSIVNLVTVGLLSWEPVFGHGLLGYLGMLTLLCGFIALHTE